MDDTTPTDSTTPAPVTSDERIGRFTRAELEALQGRRGRKPAEFYQLFPDKAVPAKTATRTPRSSRVTPRVSSALLGDESIDDLLARAGSKGSKPAAYHILVAAAEHLLAADAVEAPIADPLARRVAEAPPKVRRLIEAILSSAE